jgi:DNA (cytosine-5)-methyltransferase 1
MVTHIDCFAGVGGVATGFHAAGIETVLAIEKVKSCVETYTANHPKVPVINSDIRTVTDEEIKQFCRDNVDIVTAGMPCETFSTAGKNSRSFYDSRQTLFDEAIRIATASNAKIILFENVPGFANKKLVKGESRLVIELLRERLIDAGYINRFEIVLNSKDFGVPQSRDRIFVLASKDPTLEFCAPNSEFKNVCVGEAFANLPIVDTTGPKSANEFTNITNAYCELMADNNFWKLPKETKCTYQKSPNHRLPTVERFKLIGTDEGLKALFDKLNSNEVANLQSRKILPKKWYIQRNRRLNNDKPSPTVTSHCIDELVHPILHRAITVREAARLQGFPDSYDFIGGPEICPHIYETQDKYEQIGDAVPPLMAYHWGKYLVGILSNELRTAAKENY